MVNPVCSQGQRAVVKRPRGLGWSVLQLGLRQAAAASCGGGCRPASRAAEELAPISELTCTPTKARMGLRAGRPPLRDSKPGSWSAAGSGGLRGELGNAQSHTRAAIAPQASRSSLCREGRGALAPSCLRGTIVGANASDQLFARIGRIAALLASALAARNTTPSPTLLCTTSGFMHVTGGHARHCRAGQIR